MIPAAILKKIRRIQITTGRLVANVFAGEYKSVFKGRGLEFFEVREYQVGDEVKMIDWNVSARSGSEKIYVKKYIEERELTVIILLDVSRSNEFGSATASKKEIAAEISSVLAGAAIKNNDKVGLIIFTDRIEKFIPPRKGVHHILRVIREAIYFKPVGRGTDIAGALEYLSKVAPHGAVVFLVSDFYVSHNIKKPLAIANKRYDIVAIHIIDPRDMDLPDVGIVKLYDAETLKERLVDTSLRVVRDAYRETAKKRVESAKKTFYAVNIDAVEVHTDKPYVEALTEFFKRRKLRKK